jgi:hypothetical protein
MKNSILIYLPMMLLSLTSCDGSKNTSQQENDTTAMSKRECYMAVYEKDTAHLSINSLEGSKIKGDLLIKYWNNPKNEGKISGRRNGDTLFADYTYIVGTYKERINKNPLAFLVRGDSLILGIGEIETKVGRSYFKPGVPINFERGRFRFVKTACKD